MLRVLTVAALLSSTAFAQEAPHAADAAPPSARASGCHPPATSDSHWDGLGVLKGGKGYADTPMGQVHYRLMGPKTGPVLLLIHQTPWSLIEWADIQPCLAERGVRTLAVDTPGYGMSDAPDGKPTIQQYADNIIPVLDRLGIRRVAVAGHHTGASIAAALAARHPERVTGVILHGAPNYNDAERAQRLALPEPDMTLKPDGSHLSNYYAKLWKGQGAYPRNLATINWSTLNLFLAGASDVAHAAVYHNDMAGDLQRIAVPLLVLSDGADALNKIDERTGAMKPNFRYQKFSDGSAHMLLVEPARWSDIAAGFVKGLPKK
ncbi:alpha/beta hydrolase [Sphingomonas sp. HITSZ_GF]|uniref:alpha/beta fold hydrolase n=1 Tax=Sphingomonas sp. HITSZ_GF TaxID=3037247 RepID=UPI00240D4E5E|nr:alpha/beta hydrolase [Sphingomonas sp. HITSZ_GF]MDG2532152.1 alpha/beta hydrolase [Sphingomonas sp. HITSZ_GF]